MVVNEVKSRECCGFSSHHCGERCWVLPTQVKWALPGGPAAIRDWHGKKRGSCGQAASRQLAGQGSLVFVEVHVIPTGGPPDLSLLGGSLLHRAMCLCVTTAEPTRCTQGSPCALEPLLRCKRSHCSEEPVHCNQRATLLAATGEKPAQQGRPSTAKIKS